MDFPFPESHDRFRHPDGCLAILMITQLSQRMMSIADRDQFAVEIYLPQEPRWTVPPP